MNATAIADPRPCADPGLISRSRSVTTVLVAISLGIQLADLIAMAVLAKGGFFRIGAGPIAQVLGLNQFAFWALWKTGAFVVLVAATLMDRRRLLMILNLWFGGLLIWSTLLQWVTAG
jgi:putative copper export protein